MIGRHEELAVQELDHNSIDEVMKGDSPGVEEVISVKGVPWVGDGGVYGESLSVVSSSDDKNGKVAGNGGIWSDEGSLDGSDSESDEVEYSGDASV
ncbi:hypothetical protein Tco_0547528 [Tanacetum coccineum]